MINKKIFIGIFTLFIFMLFLNNVNAVPPFGTSTNELLGLEIRPMMLDTIKQNENFTFHWHVFNLSTGFPITTGISCYANVYDIFGEHILVNYIGQVDGTGVNGFDYEIFANSSNFTRSGEYAINIQCNGSAIGGGTSSSFIVSKTGYNSSADTNLYPLIIAIITFIVLTFALKEDFLKTIFIFLSLLTTLILLNILYLSIIDPTISNELYLWYRILFWTIIICLIYTGYKILRKLIAMISGEGEEEENEEH